MPRILVIDSDMPGAAPGEVERLCWRQLDAARLARARPESIVCPLLATEFDALDVIARLSRLGWQGGLHVLFPELPDPGLVRRELQARARRGAPGITVQVLDSAAAL